MLNSKERKLTLTSILMKYEWNIIYISNTEIVSIFYFLIVNLNNLHSRFYELLNPNLRTDFLNSKCRIQYSDQTF